VATGNPKGRAMYARNLATALVFRTMLFVNLITVDMVFPVSVCKKVIKRYFFITTENI